MLSLLSQFAVLLISFFWASPHLKTYNNPIISGFAPDPSCVRVEEQFYCVSSSFSAFPGIPVYTSRDLVNWQQIGNVLSRPEQVPDLATISTSTGGIWACTIRYHDGIFYVITTLVKDHEAGDSLARWQNVIFTAKDIWANNGNGWSDPVFFDFVGYDTSVFWDDDGKAYMQGGRYWVTPGLDLWEIDLTTGKNLTEHTTIWKGTGGFAPEGPHIYRRKDGYYLMIAEGGTELGHMVTMAKAPKITGPYTSYENNPIWTSVNTSLYLQTVGHADLFTDVDGNWWGVALSTRNGSANFPMGRETVLAPVVWEGGKYPVVNSADPGRVHVEMTGPLPPTRSPTDRDIPDPLVGHSQHIDFPPWTNAPLSTLPRQLVYYRLPDFSRFTISPRGHPGTLQIMGSAENITGKGGRGTSSFILRRQDAVEFTAEASLEFSPDLQNPMVENEEAGMTLFIQRLQHLDLGVIVKRNSTTKALQKFIQLRTVTFHSSPDGLSDDYSKPGSFPLSNDVTSLRLRVQAVNASTYTFSYVETKDGKDVDERWTIVGYGNATEISGGFTGTLVGMYATGNGHNSTTPALFSRFTYDPMRGVF